jgi:hypothetical protein
MFRIVADLSVRNVHVGDQRRHYGATWIRAYICADDSPRDSFCNRGYSCAILRGFRAVIAQSSDFYVSCGQTT